MSPTFSTSEDVLEEAVSDETATSPRQGVSRSKLNAILLSLVVVCFNAVGNLSLAWGMKHSPAVGVNPFDYVRAMINPYVAVGICLLILWLLTRMALMSWADLSFVLPLMAIGYVVAAVLGKFVLAESINGAQWTGIVLIFAGSLMVGTTHHRSAETGSVGNRD